jgi:hypothetical protein
LGGIEITDCQGSKADEQDQKNENEYPVSFCSIETKKFLKSIFHKKNAYKNSG